MNFTKILQSFEKLNVIIVGDIMLDRYQTGRVSRISPEAPVPVVECTNEENRLGGAANVALNIRSLGATPYLCGLAGRDAESAVIFDLMPASGLDDRGIVLSNERITTVKTRIIAGNQHLLRLDREQTDYLTANEEEKFLKSLLDLLNSMTFHVMILQDYNKGVLTKNVIAQLLKEAKKRKIPVAVDPKFRNFWCYQGVDLLKPNLKEVRDALNIPVSSDAFSLRKASEMMRERLNNRYTLITLSEKGAFIDDETGGQLYPTHPRNVADVCGAGDTVISVAALSLALGLEMEDIARLSNLAGGQVVEKVGVVPVDKMQLQKEILEMSLHPEYKH
jgi:D-glycero-beta-D-manno-heptose-7-phosphate kinase